MKSSSVALVVLTIAVLYAQSESGHPIGYLISATSRSRTAYSHISNYATRNTTNTLIIQEYNSSLHGLIEACCALVDKGVTVVLTSAGSSTTAIAADLLSPLKIPLIAVAATDPYLPDPSRKFLLRMSPSDDYQSEAIFELIKHYKWESVSILASTDTYGLHGMLRLQYLLVKEHGYFVDNILFFDPHKGVNQELHELKYALARVIVLNCPASVGKWVLEAANEHQMMDSGFVWIVTDDMASDPEALSEDGVHLTFLDGLIGIRPAVDRGKRYRQFRDSFLKQNHSSTEITSYTLMTFDGFGLVEEALEKIPQQATQAVGCSSKQGWEYGEELMAILHDTDYTGITGQINFTEAGESRRVVYDIVNFKEAHFEMIGSWHNGSQLKIVSGSVKFLGGEEEPPSSYAITLVGKHLRLGALPEGPFSYLQPEGSLCEGNDCWSGVCIEVVKQLSKDLKFTYEFVQPEDGKWGGYNITTGKWDGIISELMEGKIDMTAIYFSTNSARKSVIDFSFSFKDSAISARVKGNSKTQNKFFFLLPFNIGVWGSVIVSNGLMIILIWAFSRFSPYGKRGAKVYAMQTCPCTECERRRKEVKDRGIRYKDTKVFNCHIESIEEQDRSEDISFYNSIWLIFTGLVAQTAESLPHCMSGRALLFTWWLFMLLIISVYTANLTAFLTLSNLDTKINTLKDLLFQDEYEWGVIGSRNPETLLLTHVDHHFTSLVEKGTLLRDLDDALERVRKGYFVFIDEPSTLDFHLGGDCDVFDVGKPFQSFEYSFGFPKGSPYIRLMDKYIVDYRESGWLDMLWREWAATKICYSKVGKHTTLDMEMLAGMFYILIIGILCSTLIIMCELARACHKDTQQHDNMTFFKALRQRLSFKKGLFEAANATLEMAIKNIYGMSNVPDLPEDPVTFKNYSD